MFLCALFRVMVLDEIDELGMENLVEVFSWTSLPSSKLILIGEHLDV